MYVRGRRHVLYYVRDLDIAICSLLILVFSARLYNYAFVGFLLLQDVTPARPCRVEVSILTNGAATHVRKWHVRSSCNLVSLHRQACQPRLQYRQKHHATQFPAFVSSSSSTPAKTLYRFQDIKMRTPALACAVFAVALSPGLAAAAPLPGGGTYNADISSPSHAQAHSPSTESFLAGNPLNVRGIIKPRRSVVGLFEPRALDMYTSGGNAYTGSTSSVDGGSIDNLEKRLNDADTLGGNAYTGDSGNVDGGSVINEAINYGMPTILNMNSNNAGGGGFSGSGCSAGGFGDHNGGGGNGYSGSSGNARGGDVENVGGMMNVNSNNAGTAGTSMTGCAVGGAANS
ncbi:hypothetical protein OBBRIDRAFT_14517 [Obba rivulosa]|uniref:Uncharacterized protein n=1 Tax=Obba rivulosa TaxID=1052685 RepID=A0A8E2DVH3_9APHY|nr:hypothetical protein OBBRIDRAFT_14517 [Obba rivulosa]